MAAEVAGEVAVGCVAEEELLRLDRSRRVDPHVEPRSAPQLEGRRHVGKNIGHEAPILEAAPPDLPLKIFQRAKLRVSTDQFDNRGGAARNERRRIVAARPGIAGLGQDCQGEGADRVVVAVGGEEVTGPVTRVREQDVDHE